MIKITKLRLRNLDNKYIYVFLFFREGSNLFSERERQTETGRQRQTAILTHNFFSWPYKAVLSSRPHSAFLLPLDREFFYGDAVVRCPSGVLSVTTSWVWLKTHTDSKWLRPSRRHLNISFHNAHDFRSITWLLPLIYKGVSSSEKFLIDGSVNGLICNT